MIRTTNDERSLLERVLGIVTEVRAGEGPTALVLTVNVFLILTAYYMIKPVREALILESPSGAEYKSYASAAIAVLLLFAVPAYSSVANRLARNRLVVSVTIFFAVNLAIFYGLGALESTRQNLGVPFYLWVGIFNMMVVAQFWAFANDLYSEEQGKRLFPLVGIGASVGAALGSKVTSLLIVPLGTFQLLLVSGSLLAISAILTQIAHRRGARWAPVPAPKADRPASKAPAGRQGAFQMIWKHHYLTLLAVLCLVFTLVNSNGEYMLSAVISEVARDKEAAGALGDLDRQQFIGQFYGEFFFYVNILGVVLQSFVVSRIVRFGGIGLALFTLPCIALGGAVAVIFAPVLLVLRVSKTCENAADYSVQNTVRHMLWLPTTREMKYKAKQAVDTFFVRMGDVSSAAIVFVGVNYLAWTVRDFALANVLWVMVWLLVAIRVLRAQRALSEHPMNS